MLWFSLIDSRYRFSFICHGLALKHIFLSLVHGFWINGSRSTRCCLVLRAFHVLPINKLKLGNFWLSWTVDPRDSTRILKRKVSLFDQSYRPVASAMINSRFGKAYHIGSPSSNKSGCPTARDHSNKSEFKIPLDTRTFHLIKEKMSIVRDQDKRNFAPGIRT